MNKSNYQSNSRLEQVKVGSAASGSEEILVPEPLELIAAPSSPRSSNNENKEQKKEKHERYRY